MNGSEEANQIEDIPEAEVVEESQGLTDAQPSMLGSPEHETWKKCHLKDRIPGLFLDADLKILQANESFCRMFGCDPQLSGIPFTKFYASFFDRRNREELFSSIVSPGTGYRWNGRVEKIGIDQLLNVSKIWILPITAAAPDSPAPQDARLPQAYRAVCLDMTTDYRELLSNTFMSLLKAAQLKDNDTGHHIERVNKYAGMLAGELTGMSRSPEVDRQFIESIGLVAALHDVGKIGTPDDILNKAGPLESWEWDVMKQHTLNGAYILKTYPYPMAQEIAQWHHEHWDGTGYPHSLSEELIPLSARIVAVADVYDALRMRRTYKEAYPHKRAVETMEAERGAHFDPFIIGRFLEIASSFQDVFSELADAENSGSSG